MKADWNEVREDMLRMRSALLVSEVVELMTATKKKQVKKIIKKVVKRIRIKYNG
jgi:hypothetical protein